MSKFHVGPMADWRRKQIKKHDHFRQTSGSFGTLLLYVYLCSYFELSFSHLLIFCFCFSIWKNRSGQPKWRRPCILSWTLYRSQKTQYGSCLDKIAQGVSDSGNDLGRNSILWRHWGVDGIDSAAQWGQTENDGFRFEFGLETSSVSHRFGMHAYCE